MVAFLQSVYNLLESSRAFELREIPYLLPRLGIEAVLALGSIGRERDCKWSREVPTQKCMSAVLTDISRNSQMVVSRDAGTNIL